MKKVAAWVGVMWFVGVIAAQDSPRPAADKAKTPESLKAEIEGLRDAQATWKKIQWRTCLLDALNEAGRENKPVLLWLLGAEPADGRC